MGWKKYKKELLSKPEVRKEYEKLQTEYKLVSSIIETRLKKKMTQAEVPEKPLFHSPRLLVHCIK